MDGKQLQYIFTYIEHVEKLGLCVFVFIWIEKYIPFLYKEESHRRIYSEKLQLKFSNSL
jgi:hypothetical protein